jgi:CIC family chloride channel protein
MGAALGRLVGDVFHWFFPAVTAISGGYALVGMAAVFAGAAQAPITSIIILFEMTGDYRIILPLMTAVVISSLVSHVLSPETIYTIKLRRRGIDILAPRRPDPLAQVRVGDVMTRDVISVKEDLPFPDLLEELRRHPFSSLPVMDGDGRLAGVLGYSELRDVLTSEPPDRSLAARDLMRAPPPVCYPEDTLTDVTETFRLANIGRLPVVTREAPDRLVGVVSHTDVLAAYERLVLGRSGDNVPQA